MSKHISNPLRKGPQGFFATVDREGAIPENIRAILFTEPGERFMRNDIGTPVRSSLWDPADDITVSALRTFIKSQLARWEPRIRVGTVNAEIIESADSSVKIIIFIEYEILSERRFSSVNLSAILSRKVAS